MLPAYLVSNGLGSPIDYENQVISLRPGMEKDRQELLRKLVDIQYTRNDMAMERGNFRVRGDTVDIYPAGAENAVRIELFGDEVETIKEINPVTGEIVGIRNHVAIYPASHYVTSKDKIEHAAETINEELKERVQWFQDRGKLIEAQRIEQRTRYDVEMLRGWEGPVRGSRIIPVILRGFRRIASVYADRLYSR